MVLTIEAAVLSLVAAVLLGAAGALAKTSRSTAAADRGRRVHHHRPRGARPGADAAHLFRRADAAQPDRPDARLRRLCRRQPVQRRGRHDRFHLRRLHDRDLPRGDPCRAAGAARSRAGVWHAAADGVLAHPVAADHPPRAARPRQQLAGAAQGHGPALGPRARRRLTQGEPSRRRHPGAVHLLSRGSLDLPAAHDRFDGLSRRGQSVAPNSPTCGPPMDFSIVVDNLGLYLQGLWTTIWMVAGLAGAWALPVGAAGGHAHVAQPGCSIGRYGPTPISSAARLCWCSCF